MTVNSQPSCAASKAAPAPESTLDWFKTYAFPELEKMRFTPSVQIALRQQLRMTYWATKCRPLTREAVGRISKAIAFADTPEGGVPVPIAQAHIDAVLCSDQGFAPVADPDTRELLGWAIPEMLEALEHAGKSYEAAAAARSAKASAASATRWAKEREAKAHNAGAAAKAGAVPAEEPAPHACTVDENGGDF